MDCEIIYLDHAAATPMDERVFAAMRPFLVENFYNPSSAYMPAVLVRREYDSAKHKIAISIGAKPGEIIITAGATESINLAFGAVTGHVVTANIEHHAVIESAKKHDNTIVRSDERGLINADLIKNAIRPNTELVSIALANNELGTIQPIREISEIINNVRMDRLSRGDKTPIYFHCDASQGVGQLDVNVARLGVDMMTLNAGKIYGPKQVGLLWVASHVRIQPQIVGGGQERGIRSGTENVAGVVGFSRAIELVNEHRKFESDRLAKLRNKMQSDLMTAFPKAVISGYQKHRLSGHLHISFAGIDGERLLFLLEKRGVLVATGSACAANSGLRSHVLDAIGLPAEVADGSIRITLGHLSNSENIAKATEIIISEVKKEYERLRK